MTIEERLARLERKNRRLTWTLVSAGGAVALLAVFAVATGMAPAPSEATSQATVVAHKFLLVDPQGKVRASLSVTEKGPGLWLYDERDTYRAGLGINASGAGLMLRDEKGNNRVVLGIEEKGPELVLYDQIGRPVWGCDENGKPISRTTRP